MEKKYPLFEFSEELQDAVAANVIQGDEVKELSEGILSLPESQQMEAFEEIVGAFISMLPAASLCGLNLFNCLFGTCAKIVDAKELLKDLDEYNQMAIDESTNQ